VQPDKKRDFVQVVDGLYPLFLGCFCAYDSAYGGDWEVCNFSRRQKVSASISLPVQETLGLPPRHQNYDGRFFRGHGLWIQGIDAFLAEEPFLGGVSRVYWWSVFLYGGIVTTR
jgi:hypothetical protein